MLLPFRKHTILTAYSLEEIKEKLNTMGAKVYQDSPSSFTFIIEREKIHNQLLPSIDITGEVSKSEKSYEMKFNISTNDLQKKYFPKKVIQNLFQQIGIGIFATGILAYLAGGLMPFVIVSVLALLFGAQFMVGMYFNESAEVSETIHKLDEHFKPFHTKQLLSAAMQIENIGKKE